MNERPTVSGHGVAQVIGPDGEVRQEVPFRNLISDIGDEYIAKRVAGVSMQVATGMRLGTGTTSPSKAGGGAAIGTYISASARVLDDGFPSDTNLGAGDGHRAIFEATWPPGSATQDDISEVALTNESPVTNVAGSAGNTLARALFNPVIDKRDVDTLRVTWNWDFEAL
jgi:hypothetical protein